MKLKSKIDEINMINKKLNEENEKKLNEFHNKTNELKNFHLKINNYLQNQKTENDLLKQSINNENSIDIYINQILNFIKNKQNLNKLATLKSNINNKEEMEEKKEENKEEKKESKEDIKKEEKLKKEEIKRQKKEEKEAKKKKSKKIKEEIVKKNKKIKKKKNEFKSYKSLNYQIIRFIINPNQFALEKNSENSLHIELTKKLKENALQINQQNKIIKIEIDDNEKILNKLKKDLKIDDEEKKENKSLINPKSNLKLDNLSDEEFYLGTIDDDDINNNIDSPQFLTKVSKKSKLNFEFNEKLDFSSIFLGMNNITSFMNAKNKKNINKSSNNIINPNKKTFNLLNQSNIGKAKNYERNIEKLDIEIENNEKKIISLKEELNKLLEENDDLINQRDNLKNEILKQDTKISSYKNQIKWENENKINITNIVSDKTDKETYSNSVNDN